MAELDVLPPVALLHIGCCSRQEMSMDDSMKLSRRTVLKQAIFLSSVAAGIVATRPAYAQKASQAAMKYQDKPNGTSECDNCQHFQPPKSCAIVEGDISPKGWCIAWVKKS
jgi:hypothetical protein